MNIIKEKDYQPRTKVPTKDNPIYMRKGYGGISPCIAGKPNYNNGKSVLNNCVGYAFQRWFELANEFVYVGCLYSMKKPSSAQYWWSNISDGFERGQTAKVGAIACWKKDSKAGHVAVVEKIDSKGNVYVSESGYNAYTFRFKNYGKKMFKGTYRFQGFIYPPFVDYSTNEIEVGDAVKIIAKGNTRADGKGKTCYGINYKREVLEIVDGAKYPYKVGNSKGVVTGYYQENALVKL